MSRIRTPSKATFYKVKEEAFSHFVCLFDERGREMGILAYMGRPASFSSAEDAHRAARNRGLVLAVPPHAH